MAIGHAAVADDQRTWAVFGKELCDEQGDGIHVVRYDNGEVKASVVCGEYADEPYVKHARYYDRQGRGLAQEENVPTDPSRSFYRQWLYDAALGPPSQERLFDATGRLVSDKAINSASPSSTVAASSRPWVSSTFNGYLAACRNRPSAVLKLVVVSAEGRQFFEDAACPCLAEKAVRLDEQRDVALMTEKGLNFNDLGDRLALAASLSLIECLCPEAIPGEPLEEACRSPVH